ncbi:hypothetical protein D3C85_1436410 [compost metagenome]
MHLELVARQHFDALRRGLGALLDFQALVLGGQAARLTDRAVELGEQPARLVLRVHQENRAAHHRQQQQQVQAQHDRPF